MILERHATIEYIKCNFSMTSPLYWDGERGFRNILYISEPGQIKVKEVSAWLNSTRAKCKKYLVNDPLKLKHCLIVALRGTQHTEATAQAACFLVELMWLWDGWTFYTPRVKGMLTTFL